MHSNDSKKLSPLTQSRPLRGRYFRFCFFGSTMTCMSVLDTTTEWEDYLDDLTLNSILFDKCNICSLILPFGAQINFLKMCELSQGNKTKTGMTMPPSEFCLLKGHDVPSSISSSTAPTMWEDNRRSEMHVACLSPAMAKQPSHSPLWTLIAMCWCLMLVPRESDLTGVRCVVDKAGLETL